MKLCPCGSEKRYLECCGAAIQLKNPAKTPEALMRSRYTAYVEENWDYIKKTMRLPALAQFNKKEAVRRARDETTQWLGLEVLASSIESDNPNIGYVEFKAKYRSKGVEGLIHENSIFHFIDGKWYYVDAKA
jgi:SEC-C motif domain protein